MNLPKSQRCRPAGPLNSAPPKTALARGAGHGYPARHGKPEIADDTGGQLRRTSAMKPFELFGEAAGLAIGTRIQQVDLSRFKSPWNVHYASYEPERKFSDRLFANGDLFDSFVKMPNTGGYAFPYSYKPAKAAKIHVANEHFNPDFFLKVRAAQDILVVEVKADDDDANRNRAKCRDGLFMRVSIKHFETLNDRLKAAGEKWRYHFYFLSPEDYTSFFQQVRDKTFGGWPSTLMQKLTAS